MRNKDKVIQVAIATFMTLAATAAMSTETPAQEKCYRVVKAGMNDCSTATAKCSGSSTKDAQADAFVFMPKGLCEKLVGGKLTK